eukprot:8971865-Lingulodinium_polyedra.AAC.1
MRFRGGASAGLPFVWKYAKIGRTRVASTVALNLSTTIWRSRDEDRPLVMAPIATWESTQ